MIFAVEVGVRCSVKGCGEPAIGLGRARTCERKFISRKWACNSMTVDCQLRAYLVNRLSEITVTEKLLYFDTSEAKLLSKNLQEQNYPSVRISKTKLPLNH